MVSHIPHTLELRNPLKQRTLNTLTQGHVRLAAALATATKLQHSNTIINHVNQTHLTTVAGQPRINLGLQVIVDALVNRAIRINVRHLGVRRLDGQLAAHAIRGVINHRIVKERFTERIDIRGEAFQPQRRIFRFFFSRLAVGNARLSVLGAGLGDKDADANARGVLLRQQISQVIVGGVGNGYGGHGNSSQACRHSARYPAIVVELRLEDEVVDILGGQADVAIRFGQLADSPLTARLIGSIGEVIVASPDYLARHGTPQVPQDLLNHNCLRFNFRRAAPDWPFRVDGRDFSLQVSGTIEGNSGEVLSQLAKLGAGIARIGAFSVADDLASGDLVPLLEAYNPGDQEPIHAVFVGGAAMPARVRAFVDFLVEHHPA